MNLALYQPEIPQNTGTLLRLGACLGVPIDIIEPCGFIWQDQKLRRAGMDYMDLAAVRRHPSWASFTKFYPERRIVLLDTQAETSYYDFSFQEDDILLLGQESVGIPPAIFQSLPDKVVIPMIRDCRSLNIAVAAAMVVGEALRQVRKEP
jgi:tRNA (cytidine/uridine-2'-O-)-methyltransferase